MAFGRIMLIHKPTKRRHKREPPYDYLHEINLRNILYDIAESLFSKFTSK